jgi:sugar lactone lactonase YvrE
MDVELVVDAKAMVGEGPSWHAASRRLFWVDILEGNVHVYDPAGEHDRIIHVGQMVGAVVPRRDGGLIVAMHHGLASLDLDSGAIRTIADPESHLPRNRFNDGKCDPAGRFWAGTMSIDREPNAGSLYCLDTDCQVRQVLGGVTCSNGIAWSLDRSTMYYIDTPTGRVDAFDYDLPTGRIGNRRVVITVPETLGKPDGMAIDAAGMLWIAIWDGGCVTRWNPQTGGLDQTVSIPALHVASCAFGGSNLDELYITTARVRMPEEQLASQPHAGGLFRIHPGVQGPAALEFAG